MTIAYGGFMAIKRYLLDTCAIKWHLEANKRMKSVSEDMEYFQGDFAVSIESVKEFVYLIQSGKVKLELDFANFTKELEKYNIAIIEFNIEALKTLFSLPFYKDHPDPTDRHIIATAITQHRILISGDSMFEKYTDCGLKYMQI